MGKRRDLRLASFPGIIGLDRIGSALHVCIELAQERLRSSRFSDRSGIPRSYGDFHNNPTPVSTVQFHIFAMGVTWATEALRNDAGSHGEGPAQ